MIDNFLRPAENRARMGADALRILGTLSVLVALLLHGLTDAAIVAFALPGLMLPRFVGMRPWADSAVSVTLLVAAWSNVFDLYTRIWWWDIVVHFVCAGALAVVTYLFLAHRGIVPATADGGVPAVAAVVLTTAFGLALGALWEMVEWFGYTYLTDRIYVTLDDTIGDMAAGGLGALAAGLLLAYGPRLWDPTALPTRRSPDAASHC
ncbi:hypothetical protein H483_0108400 [Dietzia sp. UCD-THP]|uniref:hypothetical protein n=1 Tax=Dietzia sp. UCD-THP TaxID=1292020 RepID=UPI0003608558|nr:hypothetical protein [Dietzia sp. UCD-THP]EYT63423.1 hypothetical protein H483_0108400 [Dietzia sp. UCD-THP]